jgi:hypothetical protein
VFVLCLFGYENRLRPVRPVFVIECDLCCSSITLTIGANPKAFFDHRTGACLVYSQTIKRKGLEDHARTYYTIQGEIQKHTK